MNQTIIDQLNQLEKKPVHGWDTIYTELYTLLNTIIEELCEKMACKKPGLVIIFNGEHRYQAVAYIMLDGSTQLHIGAQIIHQFLLAPPISESYRYQQAFKWIIAHELGHLMDPNFQAFGSPGIYQLRNIIDLIGQIWIGIGIGFLFFTTHLAHQSNGKIILLSGIVFYVLYKTMIMLLRRRFEYSADALSSTPTTGFTANDAQLALTIMINDIKHYVRQQATAPAVPLPIRWYLWLWEKWRLCQLFYMYPSIPSRIQKMAKHLIR